jgi:hypothetical protein
MLIQSRGIPRLWWLTALATQTSSHEPLHFPSMLFGSIIRNLVFLSTHLMTLLIHTQGRFRFLHQAVSVFLPTISHGRLQRLPHKQEMRNTHCLVSESHWPDGAFSSENSPDIKTVSVCTNSSNTALTQERRPCPQDVSYQNKIDRFPRFVDYRVD